MKIVDSLLPASADYIEEVLVQKNFIHKDYKVEGLIKAAELLGVKSRVSQVIKVNEERFVLSENHISTPDIILSKATKDISHNGAVSISSISNEISIEEISKINKEKFVRDVISSVNEVIWIGKNEDWLYFGNKGRNRLLSRLRKIFLVVESAPIENIREGIKRAWKKNKKRSSIVLPKNVLIDLVNSSPEFKSDKNKIVYPIFDKLISEDLRLFEKKIFDYIKNSDGMMVREKELEDALVTNVTEKYNFSMALNHSAIFFRKERGVYILVGSPK